MRQSQEQLLTISCFSVLIRFINCFVLRHENISQSLLKPSCLMVGEWVCRWVSWGIGPALLCPLQVKFFTSTFPVSLLWQWLQLSGVIQPLAGLGERGYPGQQCLFLGQTCLLKVLLTLLDAKSLYHFLFTHPHGCWDFEGELALSALILEFSLLLTHTLLCSHDNKLVLNRHTQNSPKRPFSLAQHLDHIACQSRLCFCCSCFRNPRFLPETCTWVWWQQMNRVYGECREMPSYPVCVGS